MGTFQWIQQAWPTPQISLTFPNNRSSISSPLSKIIVLSLPKVYKITAREVTMAGYTESLPPLIVSRLIEMCMWWNIDNVIFIISSVQFCGIKYIHIVV